MRERRAEDLDGGEEGGEAGVGVGFVFVFVFGGGGGRAWWSRGVVVVRSRERGLEEGMSWEEEAEDEETRRRLLEY
jgi:uncharacterized protein YjlB